MNDLVEQLFSKIFAAIVLDLFFGLKMLPDTMGSMGFFSVVGRDTSPGLNRFPTLDLASFLLLLRSFVDFRRHLRFADLPQQLRKF